MNGKLIFQLSLFGFAMGIATVFAIPSNIEPAFWLVIFILSGYLIATRAPGRYFLHGLCVGLANCVWITGFHILFLDRYLAGHPREAAMMSTMPLPDSPRLMMALVGPVVGIVSGILIGIIAVIAARFVRRSGPVVAR